ncbi:hypothetical protein JCM3766R1_003434 [Sporobolomyces carnicolor]
MKALNFAYPPYLRVFQKWKNEVVAIFSAEDFEDHRVFDTFVKDAHVNETKLVEAGDVVDEFSATRFKRLIESFRGAKRLNALLARAYETSSLLQKIRSDDEVPEEMQGSLMWRYTADFFALTPETLRPNLHKPTAASRRPETLPSIQSLLRTPSP